MADGKKSFIAYSDWDGMFQALPNEVAGKLIKHIFAYVNDRNPESDDYIINALFEQVKSTLKRDLVKWEQQREQRSLAGKKSAETRSTKSNERSTSVDENERKSTVSVSVNVSDSVKEIHSLVGTADQYAKLEKSSKEISNFIKTNKPRFIAPYTDLWNLFSEKYATAKVKAETEIRKKKIKVRTGEANFDFPEILKKAADQKFALESAWFNFDFLIENDTNYMKVLEGKYIQKNEVAQPKPTQSISRPNYE